MGSGQVDLKTNAFCNRSYCPGVVGLSTSEGGPSDLYSVIGHTVLV